MSAVPTLVCVHAHPDDEALFTSGASLLAARRGLATVLVTCTDGRYGFDPAGRAGDDPAHDAAATAERRAAELDRAARQAGFARRVSLGYADSGMAGWASAAAPNAFARADVAAVGATLAALFDEVGATVVLTYDERGFYDHPDHIAANAVTRAAVARSATVERLYYRVVPTSVLTRFVPDAHALEVFLPAWVLDAGIGVADERVTTALDTTAVLDQQRAAMVCHASQVDNADLIGLDPEMFTRLFGTEYYERAWSRQPAAGDADDLFGGLTWD